MDAKADQSKLAADVVVSVLAVQNFSIERAFGLLDGLEAQGFFDFQAVAQWSEAEALQRLEAAGLSRGPHFNQIFATRIRSIARALGTTGLADLLRLEVERNVRAIEDKLLDLWGVGPAVVWNYKVLRSLNEALRTEHKRD